MAAPRPALVKQGSKAKGHAHMKWDEANLEENEKIKAELPVVKITEPKTPYHAPLQGDASELEPLDLDGPVAGEHAAAAASGSGERPSFEAARKKHYNAKEALAAGRKLVDEDDEEEGV